MRHLHITATIIGESRLLRDESERGDGTNYNASKHCPIVLAARKQYAPDHYGAHSFLGKYATEEGKKSGWTFIRTFDHEGEATLSPKVEPIEIELLDEPR